MDRDHDQAGSDLALLRASAVPEGDHYRIRGQKIFISFGEHDLADNIIHLVLARTPNAPAGVKGISLFLVPKFLVDDDGGLGERNDVSCVSIEHKLGIHASPTATLAFGDKGGAIGYLLGEENRGLESMFIMMNEARFAVGMQGVAIAERAYQRALAWAKERLQGKDAANGGHVVPIIRHPDVRRMLMSMKSRTEAMRALAYVVAGLLDTARRHPDALARARAQALAELLIPVVKGWSTESAIDIASIGLQIHGGMGYVEETGAAQHLRDARITTIYEGTTGIQAIDLVGRKILRDDGQAARTLIADIEGVADGLDHAPGDDLAAIKTRLRGGVAALSAAVDWIRTAGRNDINAVLCGATPFLQLLGSVGRMANGACRAHRPQQTRRRRKRPLVLSRQDRDRTVLCRPCAVPGGRIIRHDDARRRGRHGTVGRAILARAPIASRGRSVDWHDQRLLARDATTDAMSSAKHRRRQADMSGPLTRASRPSRARPAPIWPAPSARRPRTHQAWSAQARHSGCRTAFSARRM